MWDEDFTGQSDDMPASEGPHEGESRKARVTREKVEAKKANASISAQAKSEKHVAQRRRAGAGVSEALLKEIVTKHRSDIKRQVTQFMRRSSMPAAKGRVRQVSDKTRSDFGDNLMRAVIQLKEIGMPIQNLSELSAKHSIALIVHWKKMGHVAATIQNKLSAMRKFFLLVGKEEMLPKAVKLYGILAKKGIDHSGLRRSQIATTSKSWTMKGVNANTVLKDAYAEDMYVGMYLEAEALFGMRLNEAIHWQPNASSDPRHLFIFHGAKGGLPRSVEYSSDPVRESQQREFVARAKIVAQEHPRGVLMPKRKTVRQAKNRFYTVMKKIGVTKSQLGVTGHGLRHEFAANLYEEVSGLRPPVEGVHTPQEYEDRLGAVDQAELAVSRALGHARRAVSGAYNGSRFQLTGSKMTREGRMLLNNLVNVLENERVADVFREQGTDIAWLTGAAARGVLQSTNQPIEITARMTVQADGLEGVFKRFEELDMKLGKAVQRKVVLVMWAKRDDPDPAEDGYVRIYGW